MPAGLDCLSVLWTHYIIFCVFQDEISVRGDETDMNDPTWADKSGCPSEEEKKMRSPQNVPGPGEDGELALRVGEGRVTRRNALEEQVRVSEGCVTPG